MAGIKYNQEAEETSYWLSYSDMMAALLLVFVLIISFTMMHSKRMYEKKEAELEEEHKIMLEQQEKLDKIIGVRSEVVEALENEFSGSDMNMLIDSNTGAIRLDSSILFDVNEYELKESGQEFLKEFMPRYLSVLLKPQFADYISEIIIEGHTDTDGTYLYNLELSQERALSVASFCLDDDSDILSAKEIEALRPIITANGRSFSDPILNSKGEIDFDSSRRVEFKFRLSDEEMVDEMIRVLEGKK
ncbi:MAG: OmpA family protein [Lachnospiraceae bacterium]|nr:OmpA family protein [Lachnospiraceae bacterium]